MYVSLPRGPPQVPRRRPRDAAARGGRRPSPVPLVAQQRNVGIKRARASICSSSTAAALAAFAANPRAGPALTRLIVDTGAYGFGSWRATAWAKVPSRSPVTMWAVSTLTCTPRATAARAGYRRLDAVLRQSVRLGINRRTRARGCSRGATT